MNTSRDGKKTAVVAVSRPGCQLALRLQASLPEAVLFLPERFIEQAKGSARSWSPPLGAVISRLFADCGRLVVFGSVGMTVRLIGPLAQDKRTDPAVVVVDDAGRFAVSVLSGHGGANYLARLVAEALGGQAVITTASDALDLIAVDLLGRQFGWRMEHMENATAVSAALVNGDTVALFQEAGERDWWPEGKALPDNVVRVSAMADLDPSRYRGALIITDRTITTPEADLPPLVIYRPKSLVVGVGCNRGTACEEIVSSVDQAVAGQGLSLDSLRNLATLDLKSDEAGLLEAAASLGVPVQYFSAEQLDSVSAPNPSALARRSVGTGSVCEAAALLSSSGRLVVPKLKTRNVTAAVARADFSKER